MRSRLGETSRTLNHGSVAVIAVSFGTEAETV